MRRLIIAVAVLCLRVMGVSAEAPKPLFNGKDLSGWETFLATPKGKDGQYGLNRDPDGVFTVATVDDKPCLRISGQQFGAITTKDEFENYHLRLEFKWGTKKWPPREKAARDSGILYHCVGPHGAGTGAWMKSFECQVQENDVGDFHSVANVIVDVTAEKKNDKGPWVYNPAAEVRKGVTTQIVRNPKADKLEGWNVVEVYALGGTAVHVVNGKVNMVLTNLRQKVKQDTATVEQPLTKGKIQLQTEGAEVFYRNITVAPLTELPEGLIPAKPAK